MRPDGTISAVHQVTVGQTTTERKRASYHAVESLHPLGAMRKFENAVQGVELGVLYGCQAMKLIFDDIFKMNGEISYMTDMIIFLTTFQRLTNFEKFRLMALMIMSNGVAFLTIVNQDDEGLIDFQLK